MRICTMKFEGVAPYSPSRSHCAEKLPRETANDYEDRTWRQKAHVENGMAYVPPMGFKIGLDRAAKMLGRQIPGKGKATYTKFFESGVIVTKPVIIAPEDAMACERVFANADGVRGSGKRVWRNFPRFDHWSGEVEYTILAEDITQDIFEEAARYAGIAVGVGRFRPERGGYFGRFNATGFQWKRMV